MNKSTCSLLAACACAALALAPEAHADFDTILNLPADGSIAGNSTIGTPGTDETQVNIGAGGSVGTFSTLTSGSEINLDGGAVGTNFTAQAGSTVNVNSGNMGTGGGNVNTFEAGSVLTVVDGAFGRVNFLGEATIGGGSFGHFVDFGAGSVSTVNGGTFVFDSMDAFAGSTLTINGGTFSHGSNFSGNLTINGGSGHAGIYSGNTTIDDGVLGSFDTAAGSTTTINGGSFANNFDHNAGSLTVNGGTFGISADFFDDTTITGGTFGSYVDFGGTEAEGGGTVNVTGGVFTNANDIYFGQIDINRGIVNISGGSFMSQINGGGDFELFADGTLNLTGTSFNLNGIALGEGLHVITDRDVNLDGVLLDGSTFAAFLNSDDTNAGNGFDYFDENATLTVTVVPEPGSLALLGLGGLALLRRRR